MNTLLDIIEHIEWDCKSDSVAITAAKEAGSYYALVRTIHIFGVENTLELYEDRIQKHRDSYIPVTQEEVDADLSADIYKAEKAIVID